jgi:hypothetical protein
MGPKIILALARTADSWCLMSNGPAVHGRRPLETFSYISATSANSARNTRLRSGVLACVRERSPIRCSKNKMAAGYATRRPDMTNYHFARGENGGQAYT